MLMAFSGGGLSDNPWNIPNDPSQDIMLDQSGYYRGGNARSLSTADTGDFVIVNNNMQLSADAEIALDNRGDSLTLSERSLLMYGLQEKNTTTNMGKLTEFIGFVGSDYNAESSFIWRASGAITGVANFKDRASLVVDSGGYRVTNSGNISFLSDPAVDGENYSNTLRVSKTSSFINDGSILMESKGVLDVGGSFTNNAQLTLRQGSKMLVRNGAEFVSNSEGTMDIFDLVLETGSTFKSASTDTLKVFGSSQFEGALSTNGSLRLSGDVVFLEEITLGEGGVIELADVDMDLQSDRIGTVEGQQVGIVLQDGSSNHLDIAVMAPEFASLELNNADLTIDIYDEFIIAGEVSGYGDYQLVINNFNEGKVAFASIADDFDMSRVVLKDGSGNILGNAYYADGYVTLIPEPAHYAFAMALLSMLLAYYRRGRNR